MKEMEAPGKGLGREKKGREGKGRDHHFLVYFTHSMLFFLNKAQKKNGTPVLWFYHRYTVVGGPFLAYKNVLFFAFYH